MEYISWFAVFVVLFMGHVRPARADWQTGTITGTQRVLREDPVEGGTDVRICAARNEWESFQILLRSDLPVPGVRINAGDLIGPDGAVLVAKDVHVYREHQLHITIPTYRNDRFRAGWYPDALIPMNHPLTGEPLQGRYVAMPFDLPANETHGFWIDIQVPPDTKPGVYRGAYHLAADGGRNVAIPIELTVWDFQLPDTPTFQTALGSPASRMRRYYAARAKMNMDQEPWPANSDVVERQIAQLLCENQINATPPNGLVRPISQPDGAFAIPKEQVDALRKFVDQYHINAMPVPHPSEIVTDPITQRDRLHAWLRAWDQAAKELDRPEVLFFTYLRDEPNNPDEYSYVQKWGPAIRAANSVVKVLVVEQTKTQDEKWGNLYGAVDIWCPLFSLFDEESTVQRQAAGEMVWTYTALCQRKPTPWWQTDYPLLNYRAPVWIAWRYRICGILYWGGMSYWGDVEDPWTQSETLDRRKQHPDYVYHGDGSLLYPGRDVGYDGVAPSMRLKALRDAIEDYEYMAILVRRGLADKAQAVVQPLAESFFHWEKEPQVYENARKQLAELILSVPETK